MDDNESKAFFDIYVSQIPLVNTGIEIDSLFDLLRKTSTEDIFALIKENSTLLPEIKTNNIPQFSNSNDVQQVLRIVIESGIENLTYEKIGNFLCLEFTI